jgi:hypothetical protein
MWVDSSPDMVAVVMEIEGKFGVTLPDEEAEQIRTMGQLYDFVHARVAHWQAEVCVTSAAFYRLRRALGEVCAAPRGRVRTRARLEDLVPLAGRQRHWQALQARLGNLYLPPLRRPAWVVRLIHTVSLLAVVPPLLALEVVCAVWGSQSPAAYCAALAILPCSFVGLWLLLGAGYRLTARRAVHIPPSCATVRDMVYTLVSRHPAAPLVSDTARASDKEIWGTLCAIVGDEFDQPPERFTRDSTFV